MPDGWQRNWPIFGSIVYNRAITYKRQNFLPMKSNRVLDEILVMLIHSRAIIVAVTQSAV